jgi:hypothetical protein
VPVRSAAANRDEAPRALNRPAAFAALPILARNALSPLLLLFVRF